MQEKNSNFFLKKNLKKNRKKNFSSKVVKTNFSKKKFPRKSSLGGGFNENLFLRGGAFNENFFLRGGFLMKIFSLGGFFEIRVRGDTFSKRSRGGGYLIYFSALGGGGGSLPIA